MYKGILPQFRSGLINAYRTGAEKHHSLALSLKDALTELVTLQHMKEERGKTADYLYRQSRAWNAAREALSKFPEQGKEGTL